MSKIEIRKVTLEDLDKLQAIGRQTFVETFSGSNTAENMKQYLEQGFSAKKLKDELMNPDSEFYFALMDQKVIGYLKLNHGKAQTEQIEGSNSLEVERIYVSAEFHGKGVGQILYDTALKVAHQVKAGHVWLGVWEENPRAISFYRKNGFVEFDRHIFRLGNDEQTDIMMKLKIN